MNSKKRTKLYYITIVLIIALLLGGAGLAADHVSTAYAEADAAAAENTIREYAVQCYALEGSYPESLDYLADHYTLTLDRDTFVYHYDYIGANMMPEISVFPIE